jgi:hypothetical protein
MKVWARSKGDGPHFAMGLVIPPTGAELEVDAATKAFLMGIETIEVTESAPNSQPMSQPVGVGAVPEVAGEAKGKKKKG